MFSIDDSRLGFILPASTRAFIEDLACCVAEWSEDGIDFDDEPDQAPGTLVLLIRKLRSSLPKHCIFKNPVDADWLESDDMTGLLK